jgi:hypothetical protein
MNLSWEAGVRSGAVSDFFTPSSPRRCFCADMSIPKRRIP